MRGGFRWGVDSGKARERSIWQQRQGERSNDSAGLGISSRPSAGPTRRRLPRIAQWQIFPSAARAALPNNMLFDRAAAGGPDRMLLCATAAATLATVSAFHPPPLRLGPARTAVGCGHACALRGLASPVRRAALLCALRRSDRTVVAAEGEKGQAADSVVDGAGPDGAVATATDLGLSSLNPCACERQDRGDILTLRVSLP